MGRFPFGYPRGWYVAAYSDELAPGEARALRCFGEDLALFRTESGVAAILDAYCAHLGAHLGVGGKVCGEAIECPFHAWRYDPSGRCVAVPKAKKLPAKAKLRTWPVRETNGCLHLWYHPAGKPPDFEVPTLEQWSNGMWQFHKKFHWTIRTHPQEILENAIDFSHFETLHGLPNTPVRIHEFADTVMHWGVATHAEEGTEGRVRGFRIEGESWGIGCGPAFIRTPDFELIEMAGATPVDKETTELHIGFLVRSDQWDDPALRGEIESYMGRHAGAVDQDVPIWEHKRYRESPQLTDIDGPIGSFRRWARQFYEAETPA